MHRIQVALVVMTGDGFFLLHDGDIPGREMEQRDQSGDVAKSIFYEATGLIHGEWALVHQVYFFDADENTPATVLYAVELPARTGCRKPEWKWIDLASIPPGRPLMMIEITCRLRQVSA